MLTFSLPHLGFGYYWLAIFTVAFQMHLVPLLDWLAIFLLLLLLIFKYFSGHVGLSI